MGEQPFWVALPAAWSVPSAKKGAIWFLSPLPQPRPRWPRQRQQAARGTSGNASPACQPVLGHPTGGHGRKWGNPRCCLEVFPMGSRPYGNLSGTVLFWFAAPLASQDRGWHLPQYLGMGAEIQHCRHPCWDPQLQAPPPRQRDILGYTGYTGHLPRWPRGCGRL